MWMASLVVFLVDLAAQVCNEVCNEAMPQERVCCGPAGSFAGEPEHG